MAITRPGGTYCIVPGIYLWRDVSRRLAVILFAFFILTGWLLGMAFEESWRAWIAAGDLTVSDHPYDTRSKIV